MGEQAICRHFGAYRTPEVPGARVGETYQTGFFQFGSLALAVGENLFVDERCRRYEDEHRIGVRSRNVQRVDR